MKQQRPPRWLRELAKECALASARAMEGGGGLDAVAHLESRVRACAERHGYELGDLVQELTRMAPGGAGRLVAPAAVAAGEFEPSAPRQVPA